MRVPRRYIHLVYGALQSGLTTAVATGIADAAYFEEAGFFVRWGQAWCVSWLLMMPVVILAAPAIRRLALMLTHDDMPKPDIQNRYN